MLSTSKRIYRVAKHQMLNAHRFIAGKPVKKVELSSMTLDMDDVALAKGFLRNHKDWFDQNIPRSFDREFAEWNASKYAFSFLGGREALVGIIRAMELKPGDEVIIPGYTCVVVANAFKAHGIDIKYCDIELDTFGLDADLLKDKVTKRTKAIVIHHLYGLVCRDYERALSIAKNGDITLIEDCAQATGATYRGKKVGNYGDVAFYSSEQTKVLNTVKGGVAATNDDDLADRLSRIHEAANTPDDQWIDSQLHTLLLNYYQFRHPRRHILGDVYDILHGRKRLQPYVDNEFHGICGTEYVRKMPAPIATLALNQLKKLDHYNALRRKTARRWDAWCEERGYTKPVVAPDSVPVYLRYPVMVEPEKKKDTSWAYDELGISLGVWFITNTHPAPWPVYGCPNANQAVRQCVNFPTVLYA